MATNYPASLDSFTNPSTGDPLNSPSHAGQHADINDAMEAVQTKLGVGAGTIGELQTWTPSFNFCNLGNGTYTAEYIKVNDFVFFNFSWTLGSTSGVFIGCRFGLPVQASTPAPYFPAITVIARDVSAGTRHIGMAYSQESGANARPAILSAANPHLQTSTSFNSGTPFTWASGDILSMSGSYRIA